jgi:hypothetical protein
MTSKTSFRPSWVTYLVQNTSIATASYAVSLGTSEGLST